MSDDQAMLFQVIGAIGCVCFLCFISIRNHWPTARAALARLSEQIGPSLAQTTAASRPTQAAASATRALLQDGRRWLLVGAPGSGKSTAARQLVRAYRDAGAEVLICDPEGAAWPVGAQLVGSPDEYEAISRALADVQTMAKARRAAFQRGERAFNPLLVLIDEAPTVLRNAPDAIEHIADLARRGRKLGVSVILLATDTQAKTLGLEGQTRLLDSFVRLETRMTPDGVELCEDGMIRSIVQLDHAATDLVLPVIEPLRPDHPQATADRLLASALGIAQSPTTGVAGVATGNCADGANCSQQPQPATEAPELPTSAVVVSFDGIDWALIAKLVQAGVLGETAALKGLGYTPGSTNARYQAARAALHQALGKA